MNQPSVRYCKKCTQISSSAVPIDFDATGVCTACQTSDEAQIIDWERRELLFQNLVSEYRDPTVPYDCIIPVSGGKDSYWQIHKAKEYGLRPLLVTYNSNNYSETGLQNLQNMREVFGLDHIFITPAISTVKTLNRLAMKLMGDMNWHGHAGIFTAPIRVAVEKRIPLMIWGEHGFMDLGGMHSYKDFVEFTYRYRHEHCLRGFEWYDLLKFAEAEGEAVNSEALHLWKYPCDSEIRAVGVRGVYLSNFFRWDANSHGPLMSELYGFIETPVEFERTYRRMSNLDDIHENGIHDYLKWVKFGYGRATDHTSKDIRSGKMTREDGVQEVMSRDHVKSRDLGRWLRYVNWTEDEFDRCADTFRDPRVWWVRGDQWTKKDIDGVARSYGKVWLDQSRIQGKFHVER